MGSDVLEEGEDLDLRQKGKRGLVGMGPGLGRTDRNLCGSN